MLAPRGEQEGAELVMRNEGHGSGEEPGAVRLASHAGIGAGRGRAASRGLSVIGTVRRAPDRDKGLTGIRSLHRKPCPAKRQG